jgi:Fe-S cluster assembly iron-binding protein IscA
MISITETAARRVQQQLERRGKGVGVMIGVRTTGCSGLAEDAFISAIEDYRKKQSL